MSGMGDVVIAAIEKELTCFGCLLVLVGVLVGLAAAAAIFVLTMG